MYGLLATLQRLDCDIRVDRLCARRAAHKGMATRHRQRGRAVCRGVGPGRVVCASPARASEQLLVRCEPLSMNSVGECMGDKDKPRTQQQQHNEGTTKHSEENAREE